MCLNLWEGTPVPTHKIFLGHKDSSKRKAPASSTIEAPTKKPRITIKKKADTEQGQSLKKAQALRKRLVHVSKIVSLSTECLQSGTLFEAHSETMQPQEITPIGETVFLNAIGSTVNSSNTVSDDERRARQLGGVEVETTEICEAHTTVEVVPEAS
ncbi:hypothetical protein Drorol1_Dr00012252 [Drosera rotundifolia]